MEKPHTGLNDCLRMLQACFRKRMSGAGAGAARRMSVVSVADMADVVEEVVARRRHEQEKLVIRQVEDQTSISTSFIGV